MWFFLSVVYIAIIVIMIYVTRWIFKITQIVANLQEQTILDREQIRLLKLLCQKMGASDAELNHIP